MGVESCAPSPAVNMAADCAIAPAVENYGRKIEHSLKLTANKLPKTPLCH